jgi:putative glutamine amidotransferase
VPNVLTWMRECDLDHFAKFFQNRPEISLINAGVAPASASTASGLLLTGGPDISPAFINQQDINDRELSHNEMRDRWEFDALKTFLDAGKPVFAICKGMQVLNVFLGGTLHAHIDGHDRPEDSFRNSQPLRHSTNCPYQFSHVNSSHHQAIENLGSGLEVQSWCADDSIIEQVSLIGFRFVLGVQYHPERSLVYESLFAGFFESMSDLD